MDAYTSHLLALAVEESGSGIEVFKPEPSAKTWLVQTYGPGHSGEGLTLTEALTALLTDLGVEVPERPSAERVANARKWATFRHDPEHQALRDDVIDFLQGLYAREPLTVLALLDGGRPRLEADLA